MKRFAELSSREKAIEVLRWVLVPVIVVGFNLFLVLIWRTIIPPALAQPPGTAATPPSDFQRYILPRVVGLLMAFGIVFFSARIAPRYRLGVAIVLAGVWLVYGFFRFVVVHLGQGTPQYIDLLVAIAGAAAAIALVYYTERPRGAITHG